VLVEIDAGLAALACDNAAANSIRAQIVVLDVTAPAQQFAAAGLLPDSVDAVLMNPPFNDATRHRISPDEARASAHVAEPAMLPQWIGAARRILKSGGGLTLIWRADGLAEALKALERGFGGLGLLPVHGDPVKPAIRVLISAVKGGRAPTKILPGLMLNDEAAQPNKKVAEILAGQGVLPLALPR
jgi:tRNA1(Val) A37 N6-methylase TrmN6